MLDYSKKHCFVRQNFAPNHSLEDILSPLQPPSVACPGVREARLRLHSLPQVRGEGGGGVPGERQDQEEERGEGFQGWTYQVRTENTMSFLCFQTFLFYRRSTAATLGTTITTATITIATTTTTTTTAAVANGRSPDSGPTPSPAASDAAYCFVKHLLTHNACKVLKHNFC